MSTPPRERLSAEQFEAFLQQAANDERRFELHHGEIVEKRPTETHAMIAATIVFLLKLWTRERGQGRVLVEAHYRFSQDQEAGNIRVPDVSLRLDPQEPSVKRGFIQGAPDLAVEIQSPSQSVARMRDKAVDYLAHGVRMVWLVYPDQGLLDVYERREGQSEPHITIVLPDDTIPGGELLPGFSVTAAELFAE